MSPIKIEILIYLIIIILLGAIRRVLNGMGNATFYSKGNPNPPKELIKYINNYHYLATPMWYTLYSMIFFGALAIARLISPDYTILNYLKEILASYLIMMGSSGMGNYWYQGYINLSAGLPFEDKKENPKSEFALGKIHFWWRRPWGGSMRKYTVIFSLISAIIGLYLIFS